MTDYFAQLPGVDNPDIFGMHENANVTFNTNESLGLMHTASWPRAGGSRAGYGLPRPWESRGVTGDRGIRPIGALVPSRMRERRSVCPWYDGGAHVGKPHDGRT